MLVHTVQDLGAAVRHARTEQRLTQAELANRLGVSRDWVVRLEHGHPRLEVQRVLDALEALGVTLELGNEPAAGRRTQAWDDVLSGLAVKRDDA